MNCIFEANQIKSNQMLIMKGINFNQEANPVAVARGSPRATCENSTERMWELVVTTVCTLWFLRLMLLGVCWKSSVPSRAFVLRSPLELIIMPRARMAAHLISVPCRQPDLGCPVPPLIFRSRSKVHSGDSL